MYSDDTQIYTSTTFNELSNTLKEINSITTKLENYFNYNYLKFNLQKTECIIFHSKSHTPPPITHIKTDIPKHSDSIKLKLKNNLRSSNKKLLKQDITNLFPQLWNKLSITVTNENNTNTFKSKLHKYLLDLD